MGLNSYDHSERFIAIWQSSRWQSFLGNLSHSLAPERLGPRVTERIFWRAPERKSRIGLSFDDGPHPVFTPRLLDILARYGVKATFFLIGRYVMMYPDIARSIHREGHEIGNHTFRHRMLPLLSDQEIELEIRSTHDVIGEKTGCGPVYLRPPMGLFTRRTVDVIEDCGYKTVIGDVYPRDPNMPGVRKIIDRILVRTRPGSLIILHDGGNGPVVDRSQTLAAVDLIIPELLARGYRFVTLSQLIT